MEKGLYNVVYNRKKRLLSDGTALVQIEAYLRPNKKYFSTRIYLSPDQWDDNQRKVMNHPNAIKLNNLIFSFIAELESIELRERKQNKYFSLNTLSNYINGHPSDSFIKFIENETISNNIANSTRAGLMTTIKVLKLYKPDILFQELNYNLLIDIERFLYSRGLCANTIDKYFRHIKRFINLAINKNLFDLNNYPFRKFKTRTEAVDREYLTPEELLLIEQMELATDNPRRRMVRDMFLLGCYTGLRFSDINALCKQNITTQNNRQWIHIRMQKTNEVVRIPIYLLFDAKGAEIVNKYITTNKESIFSRITNHHANIFLREIVALAGIHKKITFHCARHTNATLLLYKGISITTIQKLLGHKKLQTTQIYSKIMDMTVISELSNVAW